MDEFEVGKISPQSVLPVKRVTAETGTLVGVTMYREDVRPHDSKTDSTVVISVVI